MVRKARSCSGGIPEEERELTADTIQSGHLEGELGAMRSASDVICKRLLDGLGSRTCTHCDKQFAAHYLALASQYRMRGELEQ
jgi:hypothetical protein